ncbi:MAG TPA: serine/threonine-protein kinase [Ktedonobacterales bacterium]
MFMNAQGPIGQVIGGYRIEKMLGPGATGAVFLGQSVTSPQTQVAVKILVVPWNAPPEDRANFQTRFRHEAQALKHLNHPHILSILAFGEEAGMHYMVLPYMAGGTLADYLRQHGGTLPLNQVASYLSGLASALDYAHSQNIIHRDIKPGNILLDAQGRPYLADFSIARLMDTLTRLTMSGQAMGTPAYMSPEQADGKNVGVAADVYSLGVVVYELVTGRLPFQANSLPEFIKKHANEPPPSPRMYRTDLPEAANAVILQALAKQPAQRFSSAGAFAQAFALGIQGQWAPGVTNPGSLTQQPTHVFTPPPTLRADQPSTPRPVATPTPAPFASPPPSMPVQNFQTPVYTPQPRKSRVGLVFGSALVLVVVVLISVLVIKGLGPPSVTNGPTTTPGTQPPGITPQATQPAAVDVDGAKSVITTFCQYVNSGGVQQAYNLTSANYQSRHDINQFTNQFNDSDLLNGGCEYSGVAASGSNVTATLTMHQINISAGGTTSSTTYSVTLVKNGAWVIDDIR